MQIIATVISTRSLGYVVDLLSDGEMFIGAFYVHGGYTDFIPDTGSRDVEDTLLYIEQALGIVSPKTNDDGIVEGL